MKTVVTALQKDSSGRFSEIAGKIRGALLDGLKLRISVGPIGFEVEWKGDDPKVEGVNFVGLGDGVAGMNRARAAVDQIQANLKSSVDSLSDILGGLENVGDVFGGFDAD